MRNLNILAFALVPSLTLSTDAMAQTSTTPSHAGTPIQGGVGMSALLTGPLGTRAASGTVTVDGTAVQLTWAGDQPGSLRPWSVHRGTCTRDEGVVGDASTYRPIVVSADGTGGSGATLASPLAKAGAYHVSVRSSTTEPTTPAIACGSLTSGAIGTTTAVGMPTGNTPMSGMRGGVGGGMPAGHAGMDHSNMSTSPMTMAGTTQAARPDSASARLMEIHMRMMADPVIRERIATDPTLQRMIASLPSDFAEMTTLSGRGAASPSKRGATTRATRKPAPRRPASAAASGGRSAAKPAVKAAAKPAVKPTAKPVAQPAPTNPMPGMDHSKMPGMGKP